MLRRIAIGLLPLLLPLIVSVLIVLNASDPSPFRMLVLKSEEDLKRTTDFRICATYRWRAVYVYTGATPAITKEVKGRNLDCSVLPLGPTTFLHPEVRIPKLVESKLARRPVEGQKPSAEGFRGSLSGYKSNLFAAQEPLKLKGLYNDRVDRINGLAVPQNYAEARKLHRKSAEQRHTDAQVKLDLMYLKGRTTVKKSPPIAAGGDFRVQLISVTNKHRAVREAARLSRAHKSVLGKLEIALVRADLGRRGIVYRLRAGPFRDRNSAKALCRKLSAGKKQRCFVIKP